MHRKSEEALVVQPEKGVTRRMLIHGGRLMAVEFRFQEGATGSPHSHPHEQIGYFLSGRFELTVDGQTSLAVAGDSYYVPPDTIHGVRALEDGAILDVFSPPREEFLEG